MKVNRLVMLPLAFLLSGVALGPIPLSEQFEKSDATIIGRAAQNGLCTSNDEQVPCVILEEVIFISNKKGLQVGGRIEVLLDNGIRESLARCCRRGKRYLMILIHHEGKFYLYHGDWSILTIKGANRKIWKQGTSDRAWH